MLTNTVGIVVFILIFTVLTASGTVIAKVLPIEQGVQVDSSEYFVCAGGRVFPLRGALIAQATRHYASFERSPEGFAALAKELDGRTTDDDQLRLTVHAGSFGDATRSGLDLEISCETVQGAGDDAAAIRRGEGTFVHDLAKLDPRTTALIFWVRPDGIDVFRAARERASAAGFASNWSPRDPDGPITFRLGGGSDAPLTIQSGRSVDGIR
jgi:hypothetical protein